MPKLSFSGDNCEFATHRLLLCLGQEHSVDLKQIVRHFPGDRQRLKRVIRDAMAIKPKGHGFDIHSHTVILRHMNATGG